MKESERAQRIIEHFKNGLTVSQAAELEGVSRGYICHITSCYSIRRNELMNGIVSKDCGIRKAKQKDVKLDEVKARQAKDPFTMAMKARGEK